MFKNRKNLVSISSLEKIQKHSSKGVLKDWCLNHFFKPSNNSAICDHLIHCNFLLSFDNFNSALLYLFDKVS